MTQEKKANRKVRVIVLAGLLLVLGGLVATPTASAATFVAGGGCTSNLASDLQNNPTWENLFGDVGRWIDCVS